MNYKAKAMNGLLNFYRKESAHTRVKAFLFMLLALSFSCNTSGKDDGNTAPGKLASWTITISGKVGHPQQGMITLQEIKDGSLGKEDTIKLKGNYTFVKKVQLTEPGYYRLNFYDKQVLNLILYKSNLEVNVDGNNPQGFYEVKGSPDLELISKVQNMLNEVNNSAEMQQINADFIAAGQRKDEAKMLQLREQYQQMIKKQHDKIATVLEQSPASLGVINLLQSNTIDKDKYIKTYIAVAEKLKKEWPNYSHTKNFVDFVNKLKITAIGQPAPEIALPNPQGQIVKLSSLKGKYVLVDFWAKWCGPCRQENPNVVRAYNKYKDKGFTVYGVSLDRNKEDWLKAIQEDGLTWTHVSDLKYWQSEAAKTYNVTGIPFSILLDPNGVIIDKNLRDAALDKRLEEIFNKK